MNTRVWASLYIQELFQVFIIEFDHSQRPNIYLVDMPFISCQLVRVMGKELLLKQVTKLEDISEVLALSKLKRLTIDNCKKVKNIEAIKEMKIQRLEIGGTTPR